MSAPAGYGKSTLVSHWLDARPEPSAWLSLTEDDNALGQFLRYVVAAVRTVFPQACLQLLGLLAAPGPAQVAMLANSLSNELDAIDTPFILVLDDYYNISDPERYTTCSASSCTTRLTPCIWCWSRGVIPRYPWQLYAPGTR